MYKILSKYKSRYDHGNKRQKADGQGKNLVNGVKGYYFSTLSKTVKYALFVSLPQSLQGYDSPEQNEPRPSLEDWYDKQTIEK